MFTDLLADEGGATAIEYGLFVALIAVALITVLQTLGLNLAEVFNTSADALAGR